MNAPVFHFLTIFAVSSAIDYLSSFCCFSYKEFPLPLGAWMFYFILALTVASIYEVCPKSSWTSLSIVLDKHIGLKAYKFHKGQHQLNKCSKFHESSYSCFGVTLS